MDVSALYKISYGLYVLTSKDGDKDNGCIINTVNQVTEFPNRITIAVNKENYTHDMILKTGDFNIAILDQNAPFSIYKQFGFQSGKDCDKMEGVVCKRTANGVAYPSENITAYIEGKVFDTVDLGTHTLFIADVTDAEMVTGVEPVTYSYYHSNVKPKPEIPKESKGYLCKICGYIYEGDTLPDDYICPWCKHGVDAFEKIV